MADKKKEYPYPKGEHVCVGYYTEKHELMLSSFSFSKKGRELIQISLNVDNMWE